jgi:hypothetical protein
MKTAKLLVFAMLALFAFGTVSAAVASAEEPMLLILEGESVTKLGGTFTGGESHLTTLGGKALTSEKLEWDVENCKESVNKKDTNLCGPVLVEFKGVKQNGVNCRSEMQNGEEKDPIGSVFVETDLHLASEKTTGGQLRPLLLFKVLGALFGESPEELTINCGGVKDKVRGVIGCLMEPGLTTVANTGQYTVHCFQNATTHDAETGECEQLCEWLTEHPFEANLGAGFEDAWMNVESKGSLNFSSFIDD